MKRLVFTVTNDLNYDQRMIRICTSLQQNGYTVLLVGRLKKDSLPLKERAFAQKRLRCHFQKGKLFYLEYNLRLFFFLVMNRFDVVCGIDLDTLLPAVLMGGLKRQVVVYDAHEYFIGLPELTDRPAVRKIWSAVGRFCIPRVGGAYTVCRSLAGIFKEQYGVFFEVIRNVPMPQPLKTEEPVFTKKIILYQGALNDGRGLPEIVEAMSQLEGVELWLAGEGDLSAILRKQVRVNGTADKIKFLGYLRPDELKAVTQKAWIGLNLLENKGLNYYYSLANKAFDYIQAEVPAIHMDFPEYRLLNDQFDIALLIPDLKMETLTSSIRYLLTDEALYNRLKENTREAKTVLHWKKEEQKLIEFYNQIFKK